MVRWPDLTIAIISIIRSRVAGHAALGRVEP